MTDEKPPRAANIFDVARLAGVSHQTVSRVLNGLPNVRPATKERVEHAIAQLRYSPSPAARALVTRRTRTIGLIAPGIADYGPVSIAMHFNLAARLARYNVDTVSTIDSDPETVRTAVDALLRQRVDAIVAVVTDFRVLEMVQVDRHRDSRCRVGVNAPTLPARGLDRPVPWRAGGGASPCRSRDTRASTT